MNFQPHRIFVHQHTRICASYGSQRDKYLFLANCGKSKTKNSENNAKNYIDQHGLFNITLVLGNAIRNPIWVSLIKVTNLNRPHDGYSRDQARLLRATDRMDVSCFVNLNCRADGHLLARDVYNVEVEIRNSLARRFSLVENADKSLMIIIKLNISTMAKDDGGRQS